MENTYAKACTEVASILNNLPRNEYERIPKEKINFYIKMADKNYQFKIEPNISLEKQNISKEANAILVTIFRDYFATEKQKETLEKILKNNYLESEKSKAETYNSNDIFRKKVIEPEQDCKELVKYKKSFFSSLIEKIKNFFNRK